MSEIKPCPFCGSSAKLAEKSKTYYKGELTYNTYVYCPNCDARGRRAILSHFPTNGKAREHAIEAWNKRAEAKLETGWISVNDRLPECESVIKCKGFKFKVSADVLLWNESEGYMVVGSYDYSSNSWIAEYDNPTHWMPLPEPPEEVSEE